MGQFEQPVNATLELKEVLMSLPIRNDSAESTTTEYLKEMIETDWGEELDDYALNERCAERLDELATGAAATARKLRRLFCRAFGPKVFAMFSSMDGAMRRDCDLRAWLTHLLRKGRIEDIETLKTEGCSPEMALEVLEFMAPLYIDVAQMQGYVNARRQYDDEYWQPSLAVDLSEVEAWANWAKAGGKD